MGGQIGSYSDGPGNVFKYVLASRDILARIGPYGDGLGSVIKDILTRICSYKDILVW